MVNPATYKLRKIAKIRGINPLMTEAIITYDNGPRHERVKNYKNMSREKLLNTLDESQRNFQNLSQSGLEWIVKMENLSQNELEQIEKMRHIKNYKSMSKEGLLIALLKSEHSHAELYKIKSNNAKTEETKKIFNELRDRFSRSKIKEIRKKFYGKEKIEQYSNELEKKYISRKEEKKIKQYREEQEKKEKNEQYLKNLEESLNKSKKYYDYDDLDYKGIKDIENLFVEVDEDYYKPVKTKGAFDDNYIAYESRGDKDKKLSIKEHFLWSFCTCVI